jgi:hypothetical protein
VPHRQYNKLIAFHPVVNEVSDTTEMQSAYAWEARIGYFDADTWLTQKQGKRSLEVFPYCAGR